MADKMPNAQAGGVFVGIRRGLRLMTERERWTAVLLLSTSILNGLLQTITIVAIVPLVLLMMDSSPASAGWLLSKLETLFDSQDRKILLLQMAGSLAALVVFKGIFNWLQVGWMSRFSASCEVRLGSFLMNRILMAPYSWLVRQNSARLRQLLFGFVSVWSRDFMRAMMKLVNDLVFVVFIVATLIWAHPVSGLAAAVVAALLGTAMFTIVRPKIQRLAETKRSGIFGANRISTDAVLGVKEVKMAGAEARFAKLFDDQVTTYAQADARAQQWIQLPRLVLEIVVYGGLIGLSMAIVLTESRSPETSGIVLLYGFAAIRLLPIFSTVVSGLTTLMGSLPMLADLEDLIEATRTAESPASDTVFESGWRKFHFENVSFHYQADSRAALDAVSISILPGKSYGIVGPSGGGKSTLIDLIAGLLEPTSGAAMVDGRALVAEQRMAWRRRFGYVAQRPFLLDDSLRNNVIFNSEENPHEGRLQRAITLARLEKVVARLPGGLDGRVGEQGALLSGGECQRVAIARALYRGADLLILDEATSSLDTLVEQEIVESLATLHGQVTTIIVSHQLGLVRHCDEIWVFDDARLAARGTHDELMKSSELYRQMTTKVGIQGGS